MIKLMALIFFIALITIVAHSVMYDTKIENMDKLVSRGITPDEACRRGVQMKIKLLKLYDRVMEYLLRRK